MNAIPTYWSALVIALWMMPVIALAARPIGDALTVIWRDTGLEATLFILAVIWIASWAFPSSADKGGGETNNPPANASSPTGSIRLFYTDSNGHLVPFSGIKEEK